MPDSNNRFCGTFCAFFGMSGVLSFQACAFCSLCIEFLEGWKEVLCTTFRSRVRQRLEGVVSPRSTVSLLVKEMPKPRLVFLSFDSQSASQW